MVKKEALYYMPGIMEFFYNLDRFIDVKNNLDNIKNHLDHIAAATTAEIGHSANPSYFKILDFRLLDFLSKALPKMSNPGSIGNRYECFGRKKR